MASIPFAPTNYSRSHPSPQGHTCPHCGSRSVYRSPARGIIERHMVRALRFYPHRCQSCDRRFYAQLSNNEIS
jgi:hypothetical protein